MTAPNGILLIEDDGTMVVQAPDGATWSGATHGIGPASELQDGSRLRLVDIVDVIRCVVLGEAT